jgi:FHA domain/DUF1707 SHOCT-like domain
MAGTARLSFGVMAGSPIRPAVLRASDADRERVIRALKDESVLGRISYDTFTRRVELALRARDHGQLAELLHDLPPPGQAGRLATAVSWGAALTAKITRAWREPRYPPLVLPSGTRTVFAIGRAGDCDLVLRDQTVSWRHAELRLEEAGWLLADLGSTNGTRVNGWRAGRGLRVQPGDCVTFGAVGFRLTGKALS